MSYLSDYLEKYYDEVEPFDFYRTIFPKGSLQEKGNYEKGKYNGIIIRLDNENNKVKRYTLTDDLEIINELCDESNNDFCLMSPISYVGKSRDSSNARDMYALAFDVDYLINENGDLGIANMLYQMEKTNILPIPTYIVSSGTGLHIYYVFQKPIPLFENVIEQLENMRKRLTWLLWHDSITTAIDRIQYEPVNQGFRMVGTSTKKGDRVRAFRVGNKVTMEYLNKFVQEENRVTEFAYKSDLTLAQAKEKYPKWYEDRIIKNKPKKTWYFKRAVYDKWLERIREGANIGHRYWCIWTLSVTAMKCNIPFEELEKDAFSLLDKFNSRTDKDGKKEPFLKEDIVSALQGYDSHYFNYPIDKISYRTDIRLEKTKRNFRTQEKHLQGARAIRDINNENWRKGNGRKPKKDIVLEWRKNNPNGSKYKCAKETKLSKNTVKKWWDSEKESM